jgi:hypothetical protein
MDYVLEYRVIRAASQDDFERLVNDALKEGWTLQGGVSIAVVGEHQPGSPMLRGHRLHLAQTDFAQALVR